MTFTTAQEVSRFSSCKPCSMSSHRLNLLLQRLSGSWRAACVGAPSAGVYRATYSQPGSAASPSHSR